MASIDDVVQTSTFDPQTGTFYVPGRTAAVFVRESPEELLENLIDEINNLEDDGVLSKGRANALRVKLEQALAQLAKGKGKQAINAVKSFINQVEAFSGKQLPQETAQELIEQAEHIIAAIAVEY